VDAHPGALGVGVRLDPKQGALAAGLSKSLLVLTPADAAQVGKLWESVAPPPPPEDKCGVPGKPPCAMPPLAAAITNVDPDPAGARITIAAGTADGVDNGMSGKVTGVKNSSFRTSGCTAQRCNAVVKAAVDDVRSSGEVVIQRK